MPDHSAKYVMSVLHLARDHEELIQHIYEEFAKNIPENKDFWLGIANVESRHVRIMEMLEEHAHKNLLRMNKNSKLTLEDVENTVERMKLYLEEVKKNGISARRAAIVAKEIEEGILEREFDQQFMVEHAEAEELLRRLCEETRGHSAAMDALMVKKDEYSLLVKENIISHVQVELARTIAQKEGLALDSVLVNRFDVPAEALLESISKHFRIPIFNKKDQQLFPDNIKNILKTKYEDMKSKLFVPVKIEDDKITYALANPGNLILRDEINTLVPGYSAKFTVALSDDIIYSIDEQFGLGTVELRSSADQLMEELKHENKASEDEDKKEIVTEDDSALVKLVNLMIEEAYHKRASDIHIEPVEYQDTNIRVRIDGVLYPLMTAPGRYSRAILSRIKIMAGLDISERRKPQSGKIQYRRWGRIDTELRVETYPSANNQEDAVIRILASGVPIKLDSLGLTESNFQRMEDVLSQPYGLVLCVGPTGSGKTTALHSAIGYINTPQRKILTIEDPIEITQNGIRQVQVNRKADVTFANTLRSFLRADPDVIMVGEMRDTETAKIALEASLTGHLVLSTLHTNNAPETIVRLLDMGLDPFSFSDSLLCILAQRLVRKLCNECRENISDTTGLIKSLREEYEFTDEFDRLTESIKTNLVCATG